MSTINITLEAILRLRYIWNFGVGYSCFCTAFWKGCLSWTAEGYTSDTGLRSALKLYFHSYYLWHPKHGCEH